MTNSAAPSSFASVAWKSIKYSTPRRMLSLEMLSQMCTDESLHLVTLCGRGEQIWEGQHIVLVALHEGEKYP